MRKETAIFIAQNTLIVFLTLALVYHHLVLMQVVPMDMAWGGRLKTLEEMYVFESISITINLLFLYGIWRKSRIVYALLTIIFALNTVGNLVAVNFWEMVIFTPITAISAIMGGFLFLSHKKNGSQNIANR
jgi:hypothetical protein